MSWAKSMTAVGGASFLGDAACQWLEGKTSLDNRRSLEFVLVSGLIMAPVNHGYELVAEKIFPGTAMAQVWRKVLSRMACAPAFLSLNFGSLALARNKDATEAISENVLPAWITGTFFWPAASAFAYRFVPLGSRPAFGSLLGAFWSTYLSFMAYNKSSSGGKRLCN